MTRAAILVGALLLLALPVAAEPSHGFNRFRKNAVGTPSTFLWRFGWNAISAAEECTGDWPTGVSQGSGVTAPTITVTRAASKYCTKSDGTLVLVTANKPAISAAGMRFDTNSTSNRIFPSEQFNAWTATNVTVSADAVVSPNLATTAERAQVTADGGYLESGDFTPTGSTSRLSIYAKTQNGGDSFSARMELIDQVTTTVAMTCTVTVNKATWDRYVCASGTIANPTNAHRMRLYPVGLTGTGTVDLFGVMHAPTGVDQTYIPTTAAAATVAGENISIAVPAWWPVTRGAALFEVAHSMGATSAISMDGRSASDGYALVVSRSLTTVTPQFSVRIASSTTSTNASAMTVASGSASAIRYEWGGTTLRVFTSGASVFSSTAIGMPASVNTTITFGSFGSSSGWIKRFCIDSVTSGCQ